MKGFGVGSENQISTILTEEVSLEGSGLFGRTACWNDSCIVPAKWVTTNATRLTFDTIAKFIFLLFKKMGGEKNGKRKIYVHKYPTVFWLGHVRFFFKSLKPSHPLGCWGAIPIENGGDNERELWPAGFKVHHSYLFILRFWSRAVEWMTRILAGKFSVSIPKGTQGNLSRHLLAFNGRMPCARAPEMYSPGYLLGSATCRFFIWALSRWIADDVSPLPVCQRVAIML